MYMWEQKPQNFTAADAEREANTGNNAVWFP